LAGLETVDPEFVEPSYMRLFYGNFRINRILRGDSEDTANLRVDKNCKSWMVCSNPPWTAKMEKSGFFV
jgi:hypothetical protein